MIELIITQVPAILGEDPSVFEKYISPAMYTIVVGAIGLYIRSFISEWKKRQTARDNEIAIMSIQISSMITALKEGVTDGKQFSRAYEEEFDRQFELRRMSKGDLNLR